MTDVGPQEIPGGFDAPDAGGGVAAGVSGGDNFALPSFSKAIGKIAGGSAIDLLKDVDLQVKIELGRTKMLIEDVLRLAEGSVVELDKLAGDPVDVYVNDQLVARGEVLVLNDNFCVRINEIVAILEEE
jgi:flagellar motor switch protein FliN/FliY